MSILCTGKETGPATKSFSLENFSRSCILYDIDDVVAYEMEFRREIRNLLDSFLRELHSILDINSIRFIHLYKCTNGDVIYAVMNATIRERTLFGERAGVSSV